MKRHALILAVLLACLGAAHAVDTQLPHAVDTQLPAVAASPGSASDDAPAKEKVVEAVRLMFAALKNDAPDQFRAVTTPDFYAFDVDKVMTADQLIEVVENAREAGMEFDWQVTEPRVHIDGQTAWITYVNRGSIQKGADTKQMTWLESAVLRKTGDAWRIRFLHSTLVSDE